MSLGPEARCSASLRSTPSNFPTMCVTFAPSCYVCVRVYMWVDSGHCEIMCMASREFHGLHLKVPPTYFLIRNSE